MAWTSKDVGHGTAELKAVVAIVLGGYLPGGVSIQKESEKHADK